MSLTALAATAWIPFVLAAALALHLLWDLRSNGPPAWYPRLRILLTLGAMTGLIAGAIWLRS